MDLEHAAAICDFLEVATHQLLFLRQLYPPESFAPCTFCGVPLQASRHPGVRDYVSTALSDLKPLIASGMVNQVDFLVSPPPRLTLPVSACGRSGRTAAAAAGPASQQQSPEACIAELGRLEQAPWAAEAAAAREERVVFCLASVARSRPGEGGLQEEACSLLGLRSKQSAQAPGLALGQGQHGAALEQVEQVFRTLLLRLSTAQHPVSRGCQWELVAHSRQLPSISGPVELQSWVAQEEGETVWNSGKVQAVVSPICSITAPFAVIQVYALDSCT